MGLVTRFLRHFPAYLFRRYEAGQRNEIDLPPERQPVADDRIHGQIAKRDPQLEAEFLAMLKACGFGK
jgi:hypothetical protein